MPALSEWLRLMLAEIARKREERERAVEEEERRQAEKPGHEEPAEPRRSRAQRD